MLQRSRNTDFKHHFLGQTRFLCLAPARILHRRLPALQTQLFHPSANVSELNVAPTPQCCILNATQHRGPSAVYTIATSTGKSAVYLYTCNTQNLHSAIKSGNGNIFLLSSFFIHLPFHLSSSGDLRFLRVFFARITKLVPETPLHIQ